MTLYEQNKLEAGEVLGAFSNAFIVDLFFTWAQLMSPILVACKVVSRAHKLRYQ